MQKIDNETVERELELIAAMCNMALDSGETLSEVEWRMYSAAKFMYLALLNNGIIRTSAEIEGVVH